MQSLGWFNRGLVRVLYARAGRWESQPLSYHLKTMEEKKNKKLQYGFKNTHTQTHQTKDVIAPHPTTRHSHFSWRPQIVRLHFLFCFLDFCWAEKSLLTCDTNKRLFCLFFIRLTFCILTFLRHHAFLCYQPNTSQTPSLVKPPATKMCWIPQEKCSTIK